MKKKAESEKEALKNENTELGLEQYPNTKE